MIKNMFKRSWLSTKRKLGRTTILVLIFFMMANLVLAAFIIKSAVSAQMDYAKSTLGGTVSIRADMDAIRENQETEMQKGSDPSEMFKEMSRPSIDINTANGIISTFASYIKDYSYEVSSSANSYSLETVETKGPSMGKMEMMGFPGMNEQSSSDSSLDSDITISGINAYAYIGGVQNNTISIKDGTYFDEDSTDSAMISYESAELNSLKVGDTFKLKNIYTEKSVPLTVIGIYDSSEERADPNTIYMNTSAAAENVEIASDFDNRKTDPYKYLDRVGITAEESKRLVGKLSGGQQQRVAIARALASNSPIIVADEPTGNLDEDTEEKIINIFRDLAHKDNKIVVIITHSRQVAQKADKILTLRRGKLS